MLSQLVRRCCATAAASPAPMHARKRFYKEVTLAKVGLGDQQQIGSGNEIRLDGRSIKTPRGNFLRIDSEPLAVAIAHEWNAQKDWIRPNRMHLTGLAMTTADNPTSHTNERFIQEIVEMFETDTIFFLNDESESLARMQTERWGQLIDWAKTHLGVEVKPSADIVGPEISQEARRRLIHFLSVYNAAALRGVHFAAESLKSVLLALAAVQGRLSVEEAVKLSLLEQEYQTAHWGRVEWAHDVEYFDSCARLAAAVLFVQLNSTSHSVIDNKKASS